MHHSLSSPQTELLRRIATASEPLPVAACHASVLNALTVRGLVAVDSATVHLTEAGRLHFDSSIRRRRRTATTPLDANPVDHRRKSILAATALLETTLPHQVLMVGDLPVTTPDLLKALRDFAGSFQARS